MKTKKMLKGELFLTLVLIKIRIKELKVEIPSYPHKVRIGIKKNKDNIIFGAILAVNLIIKTSIDALLTPYLMQEYGPVNCFISTNIIYGVMGVLCVFWYDTLKKDWLMIEALKKYRLNGGHLLHKNRIIRFLLKKNKWGDFVKRGALFFKHPALYVIEYRDGISLYNGFAGKNTVILYLVYLLLMNLYWNGMVYLGIHIWSSLWDLLKFIVFLNFKIYL